MVMVETAFKLSKESSYLGEIIKELLDVYDSVEIKALRDFYAIILKDKGQRFEIDDNGVYDD
jgi:hypothetical protein